MSTLSSTTSTKLEESGKRSFTIVEMKSRQKLKSKKNGRYISKSSKGAAIKAFNRECRESKIKGVCTFMITIRETTRGSKKTIYQYKVNRRLIKGCPLIIKKGDTNVIIRYTTTAKLIAKYRH